MRQRGMTAYDRVLRDLRRRPRSWLVTGAAGFIGSNLVETLLRWNQRVVGLDNFATGHRRNLEEVREQLTAAQWRRFRFVEGDLCDTRCCRRVCARVDAVLHQAALGSVPRSMAEPLASHASNVTGFLVLAQAAQAAGVRRFVYASSSAVYGDHPRLPKIESRIGRPLSPYAATKHMNEIYADVWSRCYGLKTVGLRYFNVFGPRQDPNGPYAAVIPKWIAAMIHGQPVQINGDGMTSRDFCYVANVVQANLLAATVARPDAFNRVYNVALGERTSLNQLFRHLRDALAPFYPALTRQQPVHAPFRPGDVRHSLADIAQAQRRLGYRPTHTIDEGLAEALAWYRGHLS